MNKEIILKRLRLRYVLWHTGPRVFNTKDEEGTALPQQF